MTRRAEIEGQLELLFDGDEDQGDEETAWVTSAPDSFGQVIRWRQVE